MVVQENDKDIDNLKNDIAMLKFYGLMMNLEVGETTTTNKEGKILRQFKRIK